MSAACPIVEEVRPVPEPADVFRRFAGLPHCVFLDSALAHPELGRYSFVAADPFDYLVVPLSAPDGLAQLAARLASFSGQVRPIAGLPPFQGGAAGMLSYDLGRQLERLPAPAHDEFSLPAMAVGLYDALVAYDHVQQRCWLVSQGLPELDPADRLARARRRLAWLHQLLDSPPASARTCGGIGPAEPLEAPQYPAGQIDGLTSDFSAEGYLQAVSRVVEYIRAGDVFQVNLAQRLLHRACEDSVSLYLRLRRCNPAPFAGYFDLGPAQVVSASPERFLSVRDREVEARPIKGTRRVNEAMDADRESASELAQSEKDRAENVMIVDLLRNDLSRVCQPQSVRVSRLCGLETYAFVHHLVSVIRARLASGLGPIDLVRAAFPGGSVTGAPKVRAMEIIAELEPAARGAYCGSLGYFGFDGTADLNILIRTITASRGWWQAPVGGGIVAQSDPQQEYDETWAKAEGLLRAMLPEEVLRSRGAIQP